VFLFEYMEIGEQEILPTNMGLEEAASCHVFQLGYVF
jgi:hypothetical protein